MDNTEQVSLEEIVMLYEAIAYELEVAIKHCNVAAIRLREQEVARGCSHGFAVQGHLYSAQKILDRVAQIHASKSRV